MKRVIAIKRINKAFCRSYSKRNQNVTLILILVIFMIAAQVAMFVENHTLLISVACVCTLFVLFARLVLPFRNGYAHKKIVQALHNADQADAFFSSIEKEMQHPSLQIYTNDRRHIYIFVTPTWLILTSPNGCLICMVRDIKDVSVKFQKSKSKFKLKVDFFDGPSFVCPYHHLHELIVELINKSKGEVS